MLGGALQQASAALGKTSQAEIGVTEEARRWAGDISEHKFNNRGLLIRGKVELKEISQQIINAQVRAGQSIGTEPLEVRTVLLVELLLLAVVALLLLLFLLLIPLSSVAGVHCGWHAADARPGPEGFQAPRAYHRLCFGPPA